MRSGSALVATLIAALVFTLSPRCSEGSIVKKSTTGAVRSYIGGKSIRIPNEVFRTQPGVHKVACDDRVCNVEIAASASGAAAVTVSVEGADPCVARLLGEIVLDANRDRNTKQTKRVDLFDNGVACPLLGEGYFFEDGGKGEAVDWVSDDGKPLAKLSRLTVHKHNLLHRGIGVLIFDHEHRLFIHQRAANKRIFPSMYDMFIGGVSGSRESPLETLLRELEEEVGLNFRTPRPTSPNPTEELRADSISSSSSSTTNWKNRIKPRSEEDTLKDLLMRSAEVSEDPSASGAVEGLIDPRLVDPSLLDPNTAKPSTGVDGDNKDVPVGSKILYLGQTTILTSYNHCLVDCYAVVCAPGMEQEIKFSDGEVQWGEWLSRDEFVALFKQKERLFVPDGLQVWWSLPDMLKTKRRSS